MTKYIPLDTLVAEIEKRKSEIKLQIAKLGNFESDKIGLFNDMSLYDDILSFIDTHEVKEVNEVPATVMTNKHGNRFISSWPGLREYDDLKEGQEIKIIISKK